MVNAPIRTLLAFVSMIRAGIGDSELGIRKACWESWVSEVGEGWIGQRLSSNTQSRISNPGIPGGQSARSIEILVAPGVVALLDLGQRIIGSASIGARVCQCVWHNGRWE